MPKRDIILIGGSAGAVSVVAQIVRGLPENFPAAILVVIHTAANSPGILPTILDRAGEMPAAAAVADEKVKTGRIYVAPPDRHLIVARGRVRVTRGPKENGFRPAVDPLFRTAAQEYGPRAIGVIVSGGLDDGMMGLIQIQRAGGVTIAQDPLEALFPSMPSHAVNIARVDHVSPAAEIPALLMRLVGEPIPAAALHGKHRPSRKTPDIAETGSHALRDDHFNDPPSVFTCPACGGVLWDSQEGDFVHYRCHVGHAYSAEALLGGQQEKVEIALGTAQRALEENAALNHQMASRSRALWPRLARHYEAQARESELRAEHMRRVLVQSKDHGGNGKKDPCDDPDTAPKRLGTPRTDKRRGKKRRAPHAKSGANHRHVAEPVKSGAENN